MGYEHQTVCHSDFEYARDEDDDGFYEIHENLVTITLVATPSSRHISVKTAFIFRFF